MSYYALHRQKGAHQYVCVDVFQIAMLTESLITNCTEIRALTTIYVLMFYQTAMLIESLITNCPGIRSIITMYALMFYKTALETECLITFFRHNGAHHYVCVDVLSDCFVDRIPYYKLHRHKGAHYYVCADVLSDCYVE